MNIKNVMFSVLVLTATFTSSLVVAGAPTNMFEDLDKVAAASAVGLVGATAGGVLGAQKGAALGAALGSAAGPVGFVVGGAAGVVVGGAAGVVTGYAGLVMTKALYNELKKSH